MQPAFGRTSGLMESVSAVTPENEPTTVGRLEITRAGGVIPLEIQAATVTFSARLNGQPAPTNLPASEIGSLYIRHRGATDWTQVGILGGAMIGPDWRLLTGTYDVQYRRGPQHTWREGVLTPENRNVVFGSLVVPPEGGPIAINLEAATVRFQARLNGQPAPTNLPETEIGLLSIRHIGDSEWTDIGALGGPMIGPDWRLVTGTYEVRYRRSNQHAWREGVLTPENPATIVGRIAITANGGVVPIDVQAATVTLSARVNGQPGPTNAGETEFGVLRMRHEGSTEWIDVGTVGGPMIGPDWRLLTGRYDVMYDRANNYAWREGIIAPENADVTFTTIEVVAAGGALTIPMSAVDVRFTARLNGQPAPTNLPPSEAGGLALRHFGSTDAFGVSIVGAAPVPESWRLVAGTYRLRYDRSATYQWREGILTPENDDTDYGCIRLQGP